MTQPLLTPTEAAEILSISVKQLARLTDDGLIRWVNVGRGLKRPSRRYEPDDIEEFRRERARREMKCPSTSAQAKKPIPSTSSFRVVDFQAIREQERNARRKPLSNPDETRPASS